MTLVRTRTSLIRILSSLSVLVLGSELELGSDMAKASLGRSFWVTVVT